MSRLSLWPRVWLLQSIPRFTTCAYLSARLPTHVRCTRRGHITQLAQHLHVPNRGRSARRRARARRVFAAGGSHVVVRHHYGRLLHHPAYGALQGGRHTILCLQTCACARAHVCVLVCVRVAVCACTCTCACTRAHTCLVRVCIQARLHARVHARSAQCRQSVWWA
jgi:hypothetical protein